MTTRVKRIYDDASPDDGQRVLVDRIWPRGISKERADLTEWCKQVSPSTELRKWYDHDPAEWDEFVTRYQDELTDADRQTAMDQLRTRAGDGDLTLLTASKAVGISEAQVLANLLNHRAANTRGS